MTRLDSPASTGSRTTPVDAPVSTYGRLQTGTGEPATHATSSIHGVSAVERPRRDLLGSRGARAALGGVVPLAVLGVWFLVTEVTGQFAPYQLPSPASVWTAAVELATWQNGPTLWDHVAISTQRVFLGFALGAVVGLVVGAAVGLSRLTDALFSGTLGAVRAVPSLAWVPLLILWMGINEDSKVTLIAIGAFFPVYTTVASALRHVDRHLVEAGRAYGLRGVSLLTRVQLPAATPSVVSGLRLALAQSWLFLVAAELIASSMGLGYLLTESANNGRVDRILLAIVLLAVLGKGTDAVIGLVEKRLLRRF
ncbi:nitrate ABC transporter permease [Actinotalea ferrariae CF5-4]|uniref:Nitrate ABC transporter permease n=1 Tax=Actinotalea ferrariae CF5-4 TaxID=948458 RepID=A0A021VZP4_9CELL|nr:ABC transporter permease [Actinotalea ferrariae]EYR64542.1 nitrate ABC transporter permease [Actinotalea ferrariae CF5-4]